MWPVILGVTMICRWVGWQLPVTISEAMWVLGSIISYVLFFFCVSRQKVKRGGPGTKGMYSYFRGLSRVPKPVTLALHTFFHTSQGSFLPCFHRHRLEARSPVTPKTAPPAPLTARTPKTAPRTPKMGSPRSKGAWANWKMDENRSFLEEGSWKLFFCIDRIDMHWTIDFIMIYLYSRVFSIGRISGYRNLKQRSWLTFPVR